MGLRNTDKRNEVKSSRYLPPTSFSLYGKKENFLNIIVTEDEFWMHHYDPENKRQSMEFHCVKTASAGKVILTVF